MTVAYLSQPGVLCALGQGPSAVAAGLLAGDVQGLISQSGWVPTGPLTLGHVPGAIATLGTDIPPGTRSRNNALLLTAARQIEPLLRTTIARYGAHRVAVILGTSTSGVTDNIDAFRFRVQHADWPQDYDYRRQTLSSPATFLAHWLGTTGPAYTISTACTSSARALLSAQRLLDMDVCDAVVCGGADTLCSLTINGFASLDALDKQPCNPFSANRAGINIGEAAALFLMSREALDTSRIALLGGGASSDAWHMSAPDPTGAGAQAAIRAALAASGITPADVGWVNLHGTGTQHNDAMESHAVHDVFSSDVVCTSTKSLTGHTLGAAGALEAALCWLALSHFNPDGYLPVHRWDGAVDSTLPALTFSDGTQQFDSSTRRIALSNSFAFGGNNASLIIGQHP